MRKLLFIFMLPCLVLGAQRIWNSSGSTDMNDGANYTGSGALLVTDTLRYNATSVVNATGSADLKVKKVISESNYTGTLTYTNRRLTADSIDWSGGTVTTGLACTIRANNGYLRLGSGVTISGGSGTPWFFIGTGINTNFNKAVSYRTFSVIGSNTIGGSQTVSLNGGTVVTPLSVSGKITINAPMNIYSTTYPFISMSTETDTINGTGDLLIRTTGTMSGDTVLQSAIKYTGTGAISLLQNTNVESWVKWGGHLDLGSSATTIGKTGNMKYIFNMNGYNLTCGALSLTNTNATDSVKISLGSGTHNIASLSTVSTTGVILFNLGTGTTNCTGNWTYPASANFVTVPNASVLNLSGSGAQSVTSAGQKFYDLTVNNSGTATVKFLDSTHCIGDFSALDGRDSIGRLYIAGSYTNSTNDSVIHYDTTIIGVSYYRDNAKTKRDGGVMSFRGGNNGTITLLDAGSMGALTIRKSDPAATMSAATNLRAHRILDSIGALKMLSYSLQCTTLTSYSSGLQCAAVTIDTLKSNASGTIGGGTVKVWQWRVNGIAGILAAGTTLTIDSLGIGGAEGALDTLRSATPGSAATVALTGTQTIARSYVYAKNITLSAGDTLDLSDGTSVDGGGNSGNVYFGFVEPLLCSLTIADDGNGSTDPAGLVSDTCGDALAISATPDAGYVFNRWTRSGTTAVIADSTDPTTTVYRTDSAAGTVTITANFVKSVSPIKKVFFFFRRGGGK